MKTEKRKIGDIGEGYAVDSLKNKRYLILDRNYIMPFGEIDIVAIKNNIIAFVEVKTSIYYENSEYSPEIRVNRSKLNKLMKICQFYLMDKKFHMKQSWQIDIISVILNKDLKLRSIENFENIELN